MLIIIIIRNIVNTKVIYDNNKNLLAALEPHHEVGLPVFLTELPLGDLQVAVVDEADNLINNTTYHSKYY